MGNLSDIIRIQNADISNIVCMEYDNKVYMKESAIAELAEAEGISEGGVEYLCKFVMESSGYEEDIKFELIRDKNIPGIVEESSSYLPSMNDTIVNLFELCEVSLNETLLTETSENRERTFVIVNKALNIFKKGDYKDAPTIEYRIRSCDREIKKIEGEIADLEKHPDVAKQTAKTYTAKTIVNSIISLVGNIAVPIAVGKTLFKNDQSVVSGKANKAFKALGLAGLLAKAAIDVYNAATYEKQLKNYLKELQDAKAYLEKELVKTKENDAARAEKVKEKQSSINNKSISDLKMG